MNYNQGFRRNWAIVFILFFGLNTILQLNLIRVKLDEEIPLLLVNQVGYLPNQKKEVYLQSDIKYSGTINFNIINNSNQQLLDYNGDNNFSYLGNIWNKHYYKADFSDFNTIGNYLIMANLNGEEISSYSFSIGPNIYDLAIERAYEFFYYQRCGGRVYELVPGYVGHDFCHMDDGILINGEWHNLTGGWHSAGDYSKHTYWGKHILGTIFALTYAFDQIPTFFNVIDNYRVDGRLIPNGVPDILDEAMWGIEYVDKLFLDNGSFLGSIHGSLKSAPPETDTDNIPGTEDDRQLFYEQNHQFSTPNEVMWAVAGLAKFIKNIKQFGYYIDKQDYLEDLTLNIYNNFSIHFDSSLKNVYIPYFIPYLIATYELFQITNNIEYLKNSSACFNQLIDSFSQNNIFLKDDLGEMDMTIAHLIQWAENNGTVDAKNKINGILNEHWIENWQELSNDTDNYFGLYKFFGVNQINEIYPKYYFNTSSLGLNSHYFAGVFSTLLASNFSDSNSQNYSNFAKNQLNWVFGTNPFSLSQMESIGSFNPPSWHHRYAFIEGNMRGAVPGAIPNGILSKDGKGEMPYFDMSPWFGGSVTEHFADYRTNEPWLPHNIYALEALIILKKYGI